MIKSWPIILHICLLCLNFVLGIFSINKNTKLRDLRAKLTIEMVVNKMKFVNFKLAEEQTRQIFKFFNEGSKVNLYNRSEKVIAEFENNRYIYLESSYLLEIPYVNLISVLDKLDKQGLAFSINKIVLESKYPFPPSVYLNFITLVYEKN